MYKTLIFDLGKTLIPFDFGRGYAALERLCGVPAAEIPKRIGAELVNDFEAGLIEPDDFVERFSRQLGFSLEYGRFCDIWSSIFLPDPFIPEELLRALKARYRLLLLSNTNAIHFRMLEATYPLLRQFDEMILSYKVKALKPSPAIYREAIARSGCAAGECFYTDDIPAYVEAARREGIDAVQFHSRGQLERDMRARGIEW